MSDTKFKKAEEYVQAAEKVEVSEKVSATPAPTVDVAAIVEAAVKAALAAQAATQPSVAQTNEQAISTAEAITEAFKANMLAMHGIRKVTANERKPTSVFNPEGKRGRKLDRVYKVNGHVCDPRYLFDRDYELLKVLREGRFIHKRVTVTVLEHENPEQAQVLITYPEKTLEDRMENKAIWRDFTKMLTMMVAEQDHRVS